MAELQQALQVLPFPDLIAQVNSDLAVLEKARKEGTTPENIDETRANLEKVGQFPPLIDSLKLLVALPQSLALQDEQKVDDYKSLIQVVRF